MNKYLKLFLIFFAVLFSPSLIYAGSANLTTYLAAPFGAYSNIRLVPQADLPDSECANGGGANILTGKMYMNNNGDIKICGSNGLWSNSLSLWEQNLDNIYLKNSELPANDAWKLGIGTKTPQFKLTIQQTTNFGDSGILATAPPDTGATLTAAGAGAKFIWYPLKGSFRAGTVRGTQWNDANIGPYSVAFGWDNTVTDDSTIAGGYTNTINPGFFSPTRGRSFIGAGANNSIGSTVRYSVIGGGSYNSISGNSSQSFIGSGGSNAAGLPSLGQGNTITDSPNSFIGNGVQNRILSSNGLSAIVSGRSNLIRNNTTNSSFIGGGSNNQILNGYQTTIAGGDNNVINTGGLNGFATIGGGEYNRASAPYATVAGGGGALLATGNSATGNYSFVGGGTTNLASGTASVVSGGQLNFATGNYSTIGGGGGTILADRNRAQAAYSTIGGGTGNNVSNTYATIGGGDHNTASGQYSTIPGGSGNNASGLNSFAVGNGNNVSGTSSAAIGNLNVVTGTNSIALGDHATINGGANSTFVYSPSGPCPVTTSNVGVFFPCNDAGSAVIIGRTTNATAGAPQNGPYKLFVNGPIGGALERANPGSVGELQVDCTTTPGKCYAVYAP